jgi:predicted PhzF superfamily epimerase YddE/YHI9
MAQSMRLPFFQVDAFASRPFAGNQACVVPLDQWLPDATLQAIAQENNVAETAFTVPDARGEADFELRWFTPAVEVALCGHATLASGHVILGLDAARDAVRFRTRRAGVLEVRRADGGAYGMDLPALPPSPTGDRRAATGMGGPAGDAFSHPGGYALVHYPSEAAVRALQPDYRALAGHGDTLFIATAAGNSADVVSRVFAPGAGIDEDPATGSAHCVLGPWWAQRLGRERFTAYQASARGARIDVSVNGDRVELGGHCVTVIEGVLRL